MAEEPRAGAFFGRRKGKKLRAGLEAVVANRLPQLRIELPESVWRGEPQRTPFGAVSFTSRLFEPEFAKLYALFPHRPSRVVVEVGFGSGEHLAAEAQADPQAGFIGCEPFVNGMAKLLAKVAEHGLPNIRVWDRDAGELLERLPPASVDLLYLLYPDPWPKRRQRKRRFVSAERLDAIARILKPNGEFRFASDIDDYAGWTLARALSHPDLVWTARSAQDWRQPWPSWQGTRYEAKAVAQGLVPTYLSFRRRFVGSP